MHSELLDQVAGSAEVTPVVEFHEVSKWYGNVIGLNKLTLAFRPASPGCSAPTAPANRRCCNWPPASFARARGASACSGQPVWNNPALKRSIGLCPGARRLLRMDDRLGLRPHLCPAERTCAPATHAKRPPNASGRRRHDEAPATAPIRGYSKGMRQRTKLAQALVHDPEVLFLDEPLTGTDPGGPARSDGHHPAAGQRGQKRAGLQPRAARSPIAHAEHRPAEPRPAAWPRATSAQIRDLIDNHPHHIVLVCDEYRKLAGRLLAGRTSKASRCWQTRRRVMVETRVARRLLRPPAGPVAGGRHGDPRGLLRRRQPGSRVQIPGEQMTSAPATANGKSRQAVASALRPPAHTSQLAAPLDPLHAHPAAIPARQTLARNDRAIPSASRPGHHRARSRPSSEQRAARVLGGIHVHPASTAAAHRTPLRLRHDPRRTRRANDYLLARPPNSQVGHLLHEALRRLGRSP